MDINARERLILALDLPSADDAKLLMDRVGQEIAFVKIGLELFTAAGPGIVRWAIQQGKQVFLDLKLLDIGETVKRATAAAAELGATLLTVHAGSKTIIVAPGIRPAGSSPDDQLSVATPTLALAAGADYLVVGRTIRNAPDPAAAAREIQAEIAAACK